MQSDSTHKWQHEHVFGQDRVRPGERRTLWVIAITATMMVIEITTGIAYGSMALLADGLHMGSHTAALGLTTIAYIYTRRCATDSRFCFGTGKVNAFAGYTSAVLLALFAALGTEVCLQHDTGPLVAVITLLPVSDAPMMAHNEAISSSI